jgi:hypothetical protein
MKKKDVLYQKTKVAPHLKNAMNVMSDTPIFAFYQISTVLAVSV